MPGGKITGILLAGGKSKRMGKDKSLLKLGSKTLLEKGIGILEGLCDEILVSSNTNHKINYRVIHDEIKNIGPLGGIISGLRNSSNNLNIVLSTDMPFVEASTLVNLLDIHTDKLITVPTVDGKNLEPLCAVYHIDCLQYLEGEALNGTFKMHEIIGGIPSKIVDLSSIRDQFLNINNPDDYQKASQKFQSLSS